MGCDIHDYVEYFENGRWQLDPPEQGGYFGRSYLVFGYLTNGHVRDAEGAGAAPDPRGIPSEMSYQVFCRHALKITADSAEYTRLEALNDRDESPIRPVMLERVAQYQSNYRCRRLSYQEGRLVADPHGDWVEHPDWHTHSTLDLDECCQAQAAYAASADGEEGSLYALVGFAASERPAWWPTHFPDRRAEQLTVYPGHDLQIELELRRNRLDDPLDPFYYRRIEQAMLEQAQEQLAKGQPVTYRLLRKASSPRGPNTSLAQVIARLEKLEAAGHQARFTFWFDN